MDVLSAAETATNSGQGMSGYWQLFLVIAGIGFLSMFARWRKRNAPPPVDTREFRDRDKEPNRYRDTADRAIVELLETSRTLNAQVDTKIRILNRLVKEAEEQTARLEKLLAAAKGGAETEKKPDSGTASGDAATSPSPETEAAKSASPPTPVFRSELQQRIYVLRGEGKSLAEIAKATNLSTTEVRFAIESMGMEIPHG